MPMLGGHDVPAVVVEDDDYVVDLKGLAVLGEPIVGAEVTLDDKRPGALKARALPSPREPTPAARAADNLTRAKREDWCGY